MPQTSSTSNQATAPATTSSFGSKGIIIAVLLVIVAVGFSVYALMNFGASEKFQGLLQKIETESTEVKNAKSLFDNYSAQE